MNLLLLFFALWNTASHVMAVTTTITQPPELISSDPFTLTVNVTGAKIGKNYLRVDIYKQGTTDYFGETFNGQEWYGGDDGTKYAPVDITSSESQIATISARLISFAPTWSANDSFLLRVRRYTSSGSYTSTEADTSAIPINISVPTQTPTPPPSPTPLSTTPTLIITLAQTPSPSPSTNSLLHDNIFISEALPNPSSGQQEWIELYNDNDHAVVLDSWFIDDIEDAGSNPQIFSLTMPAKSYGTINVQSALFNNDGDSIRLLDSNKIQKDFISYSQTQTGSSLSRINIHSVNICFTIPTKNYQNGECIISPDSVLDSQTNTISQASVLGESSESIDSLPEEDAYTNPSPTSTYSLGHDYNNIQPSTYQENSTFSVPKQTFALPYSLKMGLIQTSSVSAGGISLLNIIYILYRMNLWQIHSRLRILFSTGFHW